MYGPLNGRYSAGMTVGRLRRLGASRWLDAAVAAVAVVAIWAGEWAQARRGPVIVVASLVVLAVLIGLPLAWRRQAPLLVLATVLAATIGSAFLVYSALGPHVLQQAPLAAFLAVLLAVFSFGAYAAGRRRILAGGLLLAAGFGATWIWDALHGTGTDFGFWVAAGLFWAIGLLFRQRLLRVAELLARADRLQLEQAERARWAVVEERSRIARELHDVIAHNVSVMVVQAGAARHTLSSADDDTKQALHSIETAGREALAELRRLLGVLRRPDDEPALAPVPGLARIGVLIAQVREAGLPTEMTVEGEPADLPPGTDLTAYRVIQEALTNSLRHAGPAHARVQIRYRPHELDLEISDDGLGAAGPTTPPYGAGHGLAGMRERVALYGGTIEASREPAGFTVRARLPLGKVPE